MGGVAMLAASLLLGVFSGSAFGTETPPENTSLPTISPTQPYVAQVLVAKTGTWTGSPTSYKYAWNRCTVESCEAIAGATKSKYVPEPADFNRLLTVSVTATNAGGSTTATSEPTNWVRQSLSWYSCDNHAIPGYSEQPFYQNLVYEDSKCSTMGAKALYRWNKTNGGGLTFGTSETTPFRMTYVVPSEYSFEVQCSGLSGSGWYTSLNTRSEVSEVALTMSGCWVAMPASWGCKVAGGKIAFNSLKGKSPEYPGTLKPRLSLEPSSGIVLAPFQIEGCKNSWFDGEYFLTGSFPVEVNNSNGTISAYVAPSEGVKMLEKGVSSNASLSLLGTVAGSSGNKLKLDVQP